MQKQEGLRLVDDSKEEEEEGKEQETREEEGRCEYKNADVKKKS